MGALIERSWEIQKRIEERAKRLGKGKYGRVLQMARKPTQDEFSKVVQLTALGILVIGAVGFTIYLIFQYLGPWLQALFR
ncbi:MAG TPA: protein translocase SEC61 complex subunit gamma [Thermoplasmata archaeon]|jgi:protein transport protein SEC61 subunit gamma-like protein|nr:protein translocase SEC61 complex subunit gamma [Thermoplasmata archaeon]